ncbi:unnamed protein product [Rotaria magnacalcarata]|uniref:Succinate dehydrogenase assembly factor 4, mitochondrial n=1 Tax=Rotaria magnacalcarata TaxID=392030 RepID=A0A816KZN2_9BILA|nr:unnamed protein product [Rotaria magnacalcarata]CAF1634591.1 unnamed protein product [Rotaria magnacalcarata]CAF1927058.1 unnamed protein product [Rotaria magnacalcarata]CAF3750900.1 unnamed protein product [Rotaria magnacalcarata]CAF3783638.1 unnamed protein product [Rotaria magnacalcarata]
MLCRLFSTVSYSGYIQRSLIVCQTLRLHSTKNATDNDFKKPPTKSKTPMGKLDEHSHPDAEKDPLKPWPNNINPTTGEVNGPRGPEPTRYGDWERKGKCVDF